MAKKTKDELVDEAHDLGLVDVTGDENYNDILELVKMAREDQAAEDDAPLEAEIKPTTPDPAPAQTQEEPLKAGSWGESSNWPYNSLGVYVGKRRNR